MSENLSDKQRQELEYLVREAAAAKQRAARKAEAFFKNAPERTKEDVSSEEYVRRLNRSISKDRVVVADVQKERIQHSLATWQEKVGPTFANATTDIPLVADRVARLQSGQGKHKTSLVLYGNLGVGKSWTAYAYINMAIAAGACTAGQVVADTETGVLGKITVSGYKKPELLEELFHPRNKIYFIDDVGQGFFSDAQKRTEVWFELIDHIYTHQLTLLMTTNKEFTSASLGQWIGNRAFDRLRALIGNDGYFEPSKVNRRVAVLEQSETAYRNQGRS